MRALGLSVLVFCGACSVIETGYIVPPEISVTSEMPLVADVPREVLLVGRPGAVEVSGGTLEVRGSQGTVTITVDDPMGAFLAVTTATLGESLELLYDLDGEDSAVIDVSDDLTAVDRPECSACLTGLFSAPDGDGFSTIVLAMLQDPTPPFTIINRASGAVIVATAIDPPPRLPAESGDLACIFRVDVDAQRTSPVQCDIVP